MYNKLFLRIILLIVIISPCLVKAENLTGYVVTDKLIYGPKENVVLKIVVNNKTYQRKEIEYKVSVLKDGDEVFSSMDSLILSPMDSRQININFKPLREFGYIVLLTIFENKKEVTKFYKIFGVLSDINKQIIMTTGIGSDLRFFVSPNTPKERMEKLSQEFAEFGISFVQFYDMMPNYGVLYLNKDQWIHPRNEFYRKKGLKQDIMISREKIKYMVSLLHKYGIKTSYYDEIGANDENGFNPDFAIYTPLEIKDSDVLLYSLPYFFGKKLDSLNKGKYIKIYSEYSPDGNPLTMKTYYANQLKMAIDNFRFDAIFLDSLAWLCESSSFGYYLEGQNKVKTNKKPDDICFDFLTELKKRNPNISIIINGGPYRYFDVFLKTKLNSIWTLEFPGGDLVKKVDLYPKTYGELFNLLSQKNIDLIIYQPFFNLGNVSNYNTLMASTFANGIGIYHKNDYLATPGIKESIKKYNNFAIAYGDILFGNKTPIDEKITVNKNILYNYYRVDDKIVINLINVNPDLKIWEDNLNKKTSVILKFPSSLDVKQITFISPDSLEIIKFGLKDNIFKTPEIDRWAIVIGRMK